MTHHPNPEQVQTVIDNLKKIEDQANQPGAFDIRQSFVHTHKHQCGTVHCVAGWYAVSLKDTPAIKPLIEQNYCDYGDGAELIARHLGFSDGQELIDYMADNPGIWGNYYGDTMFHFLRAYTGLKFSAKPMTTIIEHWQQVKRNLENRDNTHE